MEGLPSGLVTFMFTDIEGSTRLHHRLGGAYESLLADHDVLVRRSLEGHGGVIVKTMGDGVFAAFEYPVGAAAAASAVQTAIAGHCWR